MQRQTSAGVKGKFRAKTIGLVFEDGIVQARAPRNEPYESFVAAIAEPAPQIPATEPEDENPLEVVADNSAEGSAEPETTVESPEEERSPSDLVSATSVTEKDGAIATNTAAVEEEEARSSGPMSARQDVDLSGLGKGSMEAAWRTKRGSTSRPSSGAVVSAKNAALSGGPLKSTKLTNGADWRADDHLVEQQIFMDSEQPVGELIDDDLLNDEERRRLQRKVRGMTEEEQFHLEKITPFMEMEEALESHRFRVECWLPIVATMLSAQMFRRALHRRSAGMTIASVVSPYIRRRLLRWKHRSQRTALQKEREDGGIMKNTPTPKVLKATNDFFVDWPISAIEELLRRATHRSYSKGECIFHAGDHCRDVYLIVEGGVEVVVPNRSSKSRPKSKRSDNGFVVADLHSGSLFGEGPHFTLEPRCATAECVLDTDVLVLTRSEFVLAASSLPQVTHECLKRRHFQHREDNIRRVFPLTAQALSAAPVWKAWHHAGLMELIQHFEPRVILRGTTLWEAGDEDMVAYFVISGTLEHTYESRGKPITDQVGPGMCVGEEEVVFNDSRTSRCVCTETCEVWLVDRGHYLPVSMRNATCAVDGRQVVNERRAERLLRPDTCPALLNDPAMTYLLPPEAIEAAWGMATPLVLNPGENLCKDHDTFRNIYVVLSGTVNLRYGADGPDMPGYDGVKLERQVIVKDEPQRGLVIGAVEFGLKRSSYLCTVRCTSQCFVWAIRASQIQSYVEYHLPPVWSAIMSHITDEALGRHTRKNTLEELKKESIPPCRAAQRRWV